MTDHRSLPRHSTSSPIAVARREAGLTRARLAEAVLERYGPPTAKEDDPHD